ncbi:hypothetical protein NXH76_14010 [Blautia schinkii]|nr:hypothetical protein [Blautia schinkii]
MAKQTFIWEIIKDAGYEPIENKNIIVSYAPANISDSVAKFLNCSNEFFVLQICKDELVLVPFSKMTRGLKKEVALTIPFNTIESIDVSPFALNYIITIKTKDDELRLSTQQKELSDFRTSALLANENIGKNWHKINLDETMDALKALKNNCGER